MEKNPLIEPENYFEGYQKSIEQLKNNPLALEFDKLCYELFEHQESGKRFIQLVTERYLIPSMVSKGNPTYQLDVLWQEGFKDFIRMLITCTNAHKQRIVAQGSSNV
jgi:hypothetical protein